MPDTTPWHQCARHYAMAPQFQHRKLNLTPQSLASRRKLEQITHYHACLINWGTSVIMSSKEIQRSRRADNYCSLRLVLSSRKQGRPGYSTLSFSLGSRVTKLRCESKGATDQRIEGSNQAEGRNCPPPPSLQRQHSGYGAHPAAVQWVPGELPPTLKEPGREASHSIPE